MGDDPRSATERRDMILQAAFARLDPVAMACAMGALCAMALFLATAILIVRGAPPGVQIGSHLSLLSHFLPGYSVSWGGGLLGLLWGLGIGAVFGWLLAALWNLSHHIFLIAMLIRRGISGGAVE